MSRCISGWIHYWFRALALITFARFPFTLGMRRKWIEHQQGDKTITINRQDLEQGKSEQKQSLDLLTVNSPASARLQITFCFLLPELTHISETHDLKSCPFEFLFKEIFGQKRQGYRNSKSSWRKLSKGMVVFGLGSEEDNLILCSCLIRITGSLKSRPWLHWTPKAYFPCSKPNPSSSTPPLSKPAVSHPIYLIYHCHSHFSNSPYSWLSWLCSGSWCNKTIGISLFTLPALKFCVETKESNRNW